MNYISTRNKNNKVPPSKAILDGIAADGGLYVPESFPLFTDSDFEGMAEMPYPERLATVLSRFLTDFTYQELLDYATAADAKFDGDSCPLVKVDDDVYIIELFHGPTSAFKDMALSVMPYLMKAAKDKLNEKNKTLILVATSGDTGKAALEGFKDADGIDIMVFYPFDGVSGIQKAQMTTTEGNNVCVTAVKGNFDDAQTAVKNIFGDKEFGEKLLNKGIALSSANSINIGRLIPQIAYYISAYVDLLGAGETEKGEAVNFVVPTGNFGNILAAYYAKKSGLPINKLICASNKNNILTDFFSAGEYDTDRTFYKTASPSMDILVSSNLERLLFDVSGGDDKMISSLMKDLKQNGKFSVSHSMLAALDSLIAAGYAEEKETTLTIENFYNSYEYLLDPHTAVAVSVYENYINSCSDDAKTVIVSTASPYKFAVDVYYALTSTRVTDHFNALKKLNAYTGLDIPDGLQDLDLKTPRFNGVVKKDEIKDAVRQFVSEK
ncbi:MAG: threonine synthase [Clostridiales bacterium]|jgi:threonine synthase|nr:threonine synthase [Clostridiales bacterium]